tara:strand:+ start:775 stop:1812 length:1038 start_codon:yes stop_codon:yes gene_type:complete
MARAKADAGYTRLTNPYASLYDSGEPVEDEQGLLDLNPEDVTGTIDDTPDQSSGTGSVNDQYFKNLMDNRYNELVSGMNFDVPSFDPSMFENKGKPDPNVSQYAFETNYNDPYSINITSKYGSYDQYGNRLNPDGSPVGDTNYGPQNFGINTDYNQGNYNNVPTYSGATYDNYGNLVDAEGNQIGDTNYSAENPFGIGNWNNVNNQNVSNDGYSNDPTYGTSDGYGSDTSTMDWNTVINNTNNASPNTDIINPGSTWNPVQNNTFTNDSWNYQPPVQTNTFGNDGWGQTNQYDFGGAYDNQGNWIPNNTDELPAYDNEIQDGIQVPSILEPWEEQMFGPENQGDA